jgi:OmpA-OmpF porin, OOP family
MKKASFILLSIAFLSILACGVAMAADQDAKGSKDHPLLSRMPDFFIAEYKDTEFDSHKFIGQDKKPVSIEGHKYSFLYRLNKGVAEPGELKIRRNIQDALKKIGGKVVFDDNFNKVSTIVLQKDGKETWVEVRSYNNMYKQTIVEKDIMKQDVVANSEAMGNDINTTGHVAVYGIYFDTGKSEIKPESDAAISEIAKLLKGNPGLKVNIVGHTDNAGERDYNMKLSKARAGSVAKELISKYGIASGRLAAYGVGPLAPVASNKTEEGRAKNRRVELVEQ